MPSEMQLSALQPVVVESAVQVAAAVAESLSKRAGFARFKTSSVAGLKHQQQKLAASLVQWQMCARGTARTDAGRQHWGSRSIIMLLT